MASPTELSLKLLRERGCLAGVVERWVPRSKTRQDLFGLFDIVAISAGGIVLLVQTTTTAHLADRQHKIERSDALPWLRLAEATEVWVHGWAKRQGRWRASERLWMPSGWVDITREGVQSASVPGRRDPAPGAAPAPGPDGPGPTHSPR